MIKILGLIPKLCNVQHGHLYTFIMEQNTTKLMKFILKTKVKHKVQITLSIDIATKKRNKRNGPFTVKLILLSLVTLLRSSSYCKDNKQSLSPLILRPNKK